MFTAFMFWCFITILLEVIYWFRYTELLYTWCTQDAKPYLLYVKLSYMQYEQEFLVFFQGSFTWALSLSSSQSQLPGHSAHRKWMGRHRLCTGYAGLVHRPNCTGFVSWAMHHLCIPVCVGESTQLMYTCSVYMGCSCCHKGQSARVNELLNVTCDSKMNVSCITIYKQYCCLIVKYNTNQNIIIIIFL